MTTPPRITPNFGPIPDAGKLNTCDSAAAATPDRCSATPTTPLGSPTLQPTTHLAADSSNLC